MDESTRGTASKVNGRSPWRQVYLVMFLALPFLSALFLALEHVTHYEFLLHLAAIPLEILMGAFLVERFLAHKEKQAKRQQLMYIKSYIFRSEMRNVFLSNFLALESPAITIERIRNAGVEELRAMRSEAKNLKYRSVEEIETVILSYVRSRGVFQTFLEWAIANDFEEIFHDMIHILHFIQDVQLFKTHYPEKLFICEAQREPELLQKVYGILRDGICKFLDYAIELKEKQPDVFEGLMADYQLSADLRSGGKTVGESDGQDAGLSGEAMKMSMASHPGMRLMNYSP